MGDIFAGKTLVLKNGDDMKCSYYNYRVADKHYLKYISGYTIEIDQSNFRQAIEHAQLHDANTWYIPDDPILTFNDDTLMYTAIQKGNGNDPIYRMTLAFKMKGTGSVIYPGTTSVGMGTMGDTNSFVYSAMHNLYAVGFIYDNKADFNRFSLASYSSSPGTPSWWGLDDLTQSEFQGTGGASGGVLHYPLTDPDMITTLNAIVRDNEKEDQSQNPYSGDDAENGGGDGNYSKTSKTVDYPDDDTCNVLDTGMFTVYQIQNKNQVKALASFLWSDNFVDNVLKLWGNPMENIISFYCLPFSQSNTFSDNITIGNVETEINAHKVNAQYLYTSEFMIPIDNRYGNMFDYVGASAQIHLPYIGYRDIALDACRGGTVKVKYRIDVTNGNILAFVKCVQSEKFNHNAIDYTFEGNCATQMPLSSVNHMQQYSSIVNSIIATGTSGVAGGIMSAVGNAENFVSPDYERSGNISSNIGNLDSKEIFVIISHPTYYIPSRAQSQLGFTSNQQSDLLSLVGKGYQKFKWVDLSGLEILDMEEKEQLQQILQGGVFL